MIAVFGLVIFIAFLVVVNTKKFDSNHPAIDLPVLRKAEQETNNVKSVPEFLMAVKKMGIKATFVDVVSIKDISIPGQQFNINETPVSLYQYESSDEAKVEADEIDKDFASKHKNDKVDYHFFRQGGLIAVYQGSNNDMLQILKDLLGPQFAGR